MSVSNEGVVSRMGDTELWVVRGGEWELPVLVEPYGSDQKITHCVLKPPVDAGINGKMLRALDDAVERFRVPAESNRVIIRYEDLPNLGYKAPGITPRFYIRWPGAQAPDQDQVDGDRILAPDPGPDVGKDFCAYLYRLTGLVDLPTFRLIWKAIAQYGPRYLIEEKKSIDLGFCRIAPCPYRANWRSLLQAKFPGFWRPEVQRSEAFEKGFHNTVLAAVNKKNNTLIWSLEVIPQERWFQIANQHEYYRYSKMGAVAYAAHWNRAVNRVYPLMLEAFRYWSEAVRLPCGDLGNGVLFGGRPIIPWVPKGRVRPSAPLDPNLGSVVVNPKLHRLEGPGETEDVRAEEARMFGLPDLLPAPRHMRLPGGKRKYQPRPDVAQPEDRQVGTHGVRMLHAPESEGPGGDVLVEGSGI